MLIDKAIQFAAVAHEGQYRKGTMIPYIIHPVSVGFLLQKIGCEEEVIAAGILHDTVEDTDIELEDIKREFGERVALLVLSVSEPDKTLPWEERKAHTIESLQKAGEDTIIITLADKTHNLRTLLLDLQEQGEAVWEKFKRGKEKQSWYHHSIYESTANMEQSPKISQLRSDYKKLIDAIFN
ncbi:HD domain-containing protein [Bacillus songklensis]|uniref:HD domain-containing protein n=1 Tax=Bacillus songklensis TaxID=1069116 RepID=A0ABV8B2L8_9BACI